ncbi:MAG TPA: hypothetical protein VGB25_00710 [Candidatus Binatia bacterium]
MSDMDIRAFNRDTFKGAGSNFGEFRHRLPCGTEAPDFTLADLSGKKVTLSGFRTKSYVVLEFGALT